MANEIRYYVQLGESGLTLYVILVNEADGTVWNTAGSPAWDAVANLVTNHTDHDIALSESPAGGRCYGGNFPTGIAAGLRVMAHVYEQAGASPSLTADRLLASRAALSLGGGAIRWASEADLAAIKGTALPAESGAGRDAAGFAKFFDVATPVGTVNLIAANAVQFAGQVITCGAGVTVSAYLGTASPNTAQTGDAYYQLASGGYSLNVLYNMINNVNLWSVNWTSARAGYLDKLNVAGTLCTLAAADVTAAVWDVALPGAYAAGKAGYIVGHPADVNTAAIADAVWDELTAGHAVVGSYGVLATAVKARTDLIGASRVAWSSPVKPGGAVETFGGVDYLDEDGAALPWTFDGWTGANLDGLDGKLRLLQATAGEAGSSVAEVELDATLTQVGDVVTIKVDMTAAQSEALTPSPVGRSLNYAYQIFATLANTHTVCVAAGQWTARKGLTAPTA